MCIIAWYLVRNLCSCFFPKFGTLGHAESILARLGSSSGISIDSIVRARPGCNEQLLRSLDSKSCYIRRLLRCLIESPWTWISNSLGGQIIELAITFALWKDSSKLSLSTTFWCDIIDILTWSWSLIGLHIYVAMAIIFFVSSHNKHISRLRLHQIELCFVVSRPGRVHNSFPLHCWSEHGPCFVPLYILKILTD